MADRRGYGSGSLYQHAGSWYGRWRIEGRRINRSSARYGRPERARG